MPTEFLSLIPHTCGFLQYLTLYNWYICVGWRLYLPGWCSQGFWGWSRLCDVGWHVCWTHRIRGRDDRGERQEVQAVLRDELSHSHEETCRGCSRIQVQSEDHFANFGPSICMIMWLNCGCFVGSETAILSLDVSALFIGHSLWFCIYMYLNSKADIQLMFRLNKVIMNFLPVISVHKFVNDVNFNLQCFSSVSNIEWN